MPLLGRRTLVVTFALVTIVAGCGDDGAADDEGAATTVADEGTGTTATGGAGQPPDDFDALRSLFGPALQDTGLELTRGSVPTLRTGPHVALYGVPAADADSPQDYLDRLLPSVVAAGEIAFGSFPDVASFDLCQEPTGATAEAPPPVTVVFLTREQWDSVPDWQEATLADLLRAAAIGEHGEVEVPDEIGELDEWQAALEEVNGSG